MLIAIARFKRRLHDCSLGFTLRVGVEWRKPTRIDGLPPAFEAPELIGHNDLTPANLIFRDGVPICIIDFYLGGPTTRLLEPHSGSAHLETVSRCKLASFAEQDGDGRTEVAIRQRRHPHRRRP